MKGPFRYMGRKDKPLMANCRRCGEAFKIGDLYYRSRSYHKYGNHVTAYCPKCAEEVAI